MNVRDESAKCSRHGTLLVPDAVMCSSYNDADMALLYKKLYVGTVTLHLLPRKNVILCVTSKQKCMS